MKFIVEMSDFQPLLIDSSSPVKAFEKALHFVLNPRNGFDAYESIGEETFSVEIGKLPNSQNGVTEVSAEKQRVRFPVFPNSNKKVRSLIDEVLAKYPNPHEHNCTGNECSICTPA